MLREREWYQRVTALPSSEALRKLPERAADRVIHIVIDGVSQSFLEEVMPESIEQLIAQGTWVKRCFTIWPSITGPAHTAMNTGAYPGTNGITLPYFFDPTRNEIRSVNTLAETRAESLGEALARQGLKTAGVCGHMNRGLQYFVSEAHIGHHAELVTNEAIRAIDAYDPDYLQIVYFAVDTVQHVYGVRTQAAREALLWIGDEIAKLVKKEAGKRTAFVITADHGMVDASKDVTGIISPLLEDLGLVWHGYGRFALLWAKREDIAKSKLQNLRKKIAQDSRIQEYIQDVWDAQDELACLGAKDEVYGSGALLLKPGYSISSTNKTAYAGNHGGYSKDEILVPLILSGTGVKQGRVIDFAETVDIAPTICHLLGCKPPRDAEGRVLDVFSETNKESALPEPDTNRLELLTKLIK